MHPAPRSLAARWRHPPAGREGAGSKKTAFEWPVGGSSRVEAASVPEPQAAQCSIDSSRKWAGQQCMVHNRGHSRQAHQAEQGDPHAQGAVVKQPLVEQGEQGVEDGGVGLEDLIHESNGGLGQVPADRGRVWEGGGEEEGGEARGA